MANYGKVKEVGREKLVAAEGRAQDKENSLANSWCRLCSTHLPASQYIN